MKKELGFLIAMIFLAISVTSFVSAAAPVLQTVDPGSLTILTPSWDTIQQGQNIEINWHVLNATTLLSNASANCTFHLYSIRADGDHTYTVNDVRNFTQDRDFTVNINGSNFTELGDYSFLIECFTPVASKLGSAQTGGIESKFIVTKSGDDYSIYNLIPMILAVAGIIIILLALAYMLHQEHDLLTLAFAGIGFYMLVPLLNIANIALENNFVDPGISGMIGTITTILTWLDYALIVYICVYVMVKVISGYNQDKKEKIEGLR